MADKFMAADSEGYVVAVREALLPEANGKVVLCVTEADDEGEAFSSSEITLSPRGARLLAEQLLAIADGKDEA
jgi:hypothetical protein